jgi:hypothetical protein
MINVSEKFLRRWAILAMVIFGVLLLLNFLPNHVFSSFADQVTALKSSPFGFAVLALVTIPATLVVSGFYLLMLVECGFARSLPRQSAWLLFLVLVPVVSGFVYFYGTRSRGRS